MINYLSLINIDILLYLKTIYFVTYIYLSISCIICGFGQLKLTHTKRKYNLKFNGKIENTQ